MRRLALLRARAPSRHTNKQIIELASYYEGRKATERGGIAHAKRGRGSHRQRACARSRAAHAVVVREVHKRKLRRRHAIDTEADARSSGDGSPLGSFDGRNYFPGTHARRHASTKSVAGSLSSIQSRKSLRLPSLISRRTESPATIKARAADERGRLTPRSSDTNSGTDSRTSRKLVNFRTLTWQSSQGESKEDSGPPTF